MNRETQGTVLLVLGLVVGRLVAGGGYQSYVKSGLFWPLTLSALVLVGVGGYSMWASRHDDRAPEPDPAPAGVVPDAYDLDGTHDHHRERIGWLLLAPIAVLLLIAPAPLGAFAAQRDTANRTGDAVPEAAFPPLPDPTDGAVDLTFQQTLVRTLYDERTAIEGVPLRLTGFVVPDDSATNRFRFTRFVVGCCAADGTPIQLLVETTQPVPAPDTWIEAVVTWTGAFVEEGPSRLPVMQLESATEVDQPSQPYEY